MITDDPGTPGNKQWELNWGWITTRTPGLTETDLPQLDANYGLGDRIELNYVGTYTELQNSGQTARWGVDDSLLGVKWRFYDAGEEGLQVSVFPQVTFPTPWTDSVRRGLADGSTQVLLPFEFERDFKAFSVDVDCGHLFSTDPGEAGWMGGVCLGKNVTKAWELDAEVHAQTDEAAGRTEWIGNLGSRITLSEHYIVLLAIGRDLSNSLGPRVSLLSYAGLQTLF